MEYKDTLLMPKTEFPMRGNLGTREIEFQARWDQIKLYERVLEKNKDQKPFILHDGPPYANGDIHIGHTLNKVLKDFVLRYQTMKGRYVPYIPGWDTHGLPIETAVTKKGFNRKEISLVEYRKICHEFAMEQVDRQKEQFKRLGILGRWEDPYITLDKSYEANQVKVFAKMVEKGLIYKGLKPVYWSPSSESALAEAEIEYQDKQSISIYFSFKLIDVPEVLQGASLLIWTTTPWTLPANLAVSVHPRFEYVLIEADGNKYVCAKSLVPYLTEKLAWKDVLTIETFMGEALEHMTYKHPLYDRISPIILGEHVTDTDGTGLVHTAPGHGEDDYRIGKTYGLDILCPVDDKGYMTEEAGMFSGLYYEVANQQIVDQLIEVGSIIKHEVFTHSYPHDWRTNKPVIFRATPQWFASIERIKKQLLEETKNVTWYPEWGELRLSNMISGREDWCISRQRAWGVPIPVFYAENDEPILDQNVLSHISQLFLEFGSNVWYERDAKDLLPKGFTHAGSPNGIFRKETDIMDVWFDSGSSHSVLEYNGLPYPADLYLEGSDQYRGWFNSSLITGVANHDQAPYKTVVSHGFVLDGQGRKMSKSIGNTIDPLKIMKTQGADLLRLWVASVDYQSDVRISQDMMVQISEGYRKIRNTFRFMLGNLADFDPKTTYVDEASRGQMNRVMTYHYQKLVNQVIKAYDHYAFDKVYRLIVTFMINDLSAYYLDYTKDILYIESADSLSRRAVQSTLYDITMGLLKLLTPIMPHTTSEAYQALPFEILDDVYLESMPEEKVIADPELLKDFEIFMDVREHVLKALETARSEKIIGKSLQAHIKLSVTEKQMHAMKALDMHLAQVLIVSKVDLYQATKLEVSVSAADGVVCDRCWNVVEKTNDDGLCTRCAHVVEDL
ncbi:MAG: isoleucine--tRNA ligase [Acholeplasmataceae bacterium]